MYFRIKPTCMLYSLYLDELKHNQEFLDRKKKLCQLYKCNTNDLTIQTVQVKQTLKIQARYKADKKEPKFDWSGLVVEDLSITDRKYHATNINRYLIDDTQKALVSPLKYDYFWLNNDLYLEIADVSSDIPILFSIGGLIPISEDDSKYIGHITAMCDEIN